MVVSEMRYYFAMNQLYGLSKNYILGLFLGGHWLADFSINFPIWYFQLYFIASIVFEALIRQLNVKMKLVVFVFLVVITIPFQNYLYGRPPFHINVLPAALVCLLVVGWKISSLYYGNIAAIGNNLYYLGALSTILGLYYVTYAIRNEYMQNILSYIGTKTQWILGLHILASHSAFTFTNFILETLGIQHAFLSNIMGVGAAIILCCGIEECVQRLKKMKYKWNRRLGRGGDYRRMIPAKSARIVSKVQL